MKIGRYKINSSVITTFIFATIGGIADLLSSGMVVDALAQVVIYFLDQPESFKPYLTDKIYQALIVFLPILGIILRLHRAQGHLPIEKIENHE